MARSFKTGITTEGDVSVTGAVTASGNLRSTNSSGDEGGEIFLNKSATNTTLTGGVTIDVWQNRLRFFEQGGDARGYYIDISTGGNGVATQLVGVGTTSSALTVGTSGLTMTTGSSPWSGSAAATIDIDTAKVPRLTTNTNTFAASSGATTMAVKLGPTQSTSNLMEWQNTSGTPMVSITNVGDLYVATTAIQISTPWLTSKLSISTGDVSQKGIVIRGVASQTANLQEWQASDGTVGGYIRNDANAIIFGGIYATYNMTVTSGATGSVPMVVTGASGQSVNLQEWKTSTPTTVASISNTGVLTATTFSGSGSSLTNLPAANVTGTLTSTVLGNSAVFIGTTSVALNRTTGNLALTGITSITGGTGTTDLDFFTANTTSANSGAIDFITGTTTTSGTTGAVIIRSGNSAAASGGVTVSTGTSTATTSGTLTLSTGNASGTGGTSGAISIATGTAGSTGNSGAITMDVGTKTTGSFGTITIGGTNASVIAIGNATNTATANLISSTSVNLNSPAINSNAATLALLATPTTITMGAAVTTLTIAGTSTANATVNIATGVTTGGKTVNIGTGGTSGSVGVNIGSSSGSASTVTINGTITGAPTAATAATAAGNLGYVGMPQNSQSGAYGLVAGDAGKHIYYTVTGQTVTIPANSNVAYQIGTTITFITAPSVSLSIAITTDTLRLANTATTGTRTLAANGIATAIKVTSTAWVISGNGLS